MVTPRWLGGALANGISSSSYVLQEKKVVELNSMAFLVIKVLQKSPRSCLVTERVVVYGIISRELFADLANERRTHSPSPNIKKLP